MLSFIKKLLGFPTPSEVSAAKAEAPYKVEVETPVVNNKTGDVVIMPEPASTTPIPFVVNATLPPAVNDQITDAVTQAVPAKKTRKPRTPKAEKPVKEKVVKEKAAKARKPAAEKTTKRSKKA